MIALSMSYRGAPCEGRATNRATTRGEVVVVPPRMVHGHRPVRPCTLSELYCSAVTVTTRGEVPDAETGQGGARELVRTRGTRSPGSVRLHCIASTPSIGQRNLSSGFPAIPARFE